MKVIDLPLHAAAPDKPAVGAPCNGCGVCCAMEPCPLSRLWLKHRRGACPALSWQPEPGRYQCGLVLTPERYIAGLPRALIPLARRWARRWIAAGVGCDCDAEPAA